MRISTVIPVYNDSVNLKKCLESISSSSPKPYEIIVVDDFSSQDIGFVAKEYPFAKIIRLEAKKGTGVARYVGVKQSSGDVVAFLDSDCVIRSDWFSVIQKNMIHDIGGITGRYIIDNLDNFTALYECFDLMRCYNRKHRVKERDLLGGCFATWRHVFDDINPNNTFIFTGFAAGEDSMLGYEITKKYKLFFIKDFFAYHKCNENLIGYFLRRAKDAYSRTAVSILYPKEISKSDIRIFYIILQIFLTILFFIILFMYYPGNIFLSGMFFLGLLFILLEWGYISSVLRYNTKKCQELFANSNEANFLFLSGASSFCSSMINPSSFKKR